MTVTVRSFAKINVGLEIGAARPDGFHALRTLYQTVDLFDLLHVETLPAAEIEIVCADPRVPCDASNTCHKVAERLLRAVGGGRGVRVTIEKRLPVQGGTGGGSSNAVAALFAMEKALGVELSGRERLRIAAEVGSDLPLFLLGGLTLGLGRGEEVYPLPELPALPCVLVTPPVAVSTPRAFRDWDALQAKEMAELTPSAPSATISRFGDSLFEWLSHKILSGVPAECGDRAGTLLLDLVRTGIANDFERVVFPQYPELREGKRLLELSGAGYASLSGSGSTLYGLYATPAAAEEAAGQLRAKGLAVLVTATLPRQEYWRRLFVEAS
jgi:4-diphosphocytidyl-2-C-methyl-D-erythritol kinase